VVAILIRIVPGFFAMPASGPCWSVIDSGEDRGDGGKTVLLLAIGLLTPEDPASTSSTIPVAVPSDGLCVLVDP
jgi:hypothetical protein